MRRRLLAYACAAVLLVALAAPTGSQRSTAVAAPLPVLTGTVRVMELGDSIAGGHGITCPDGTSFGRRWAMGTWMNANPGVSVTFVGSQTSTCHPGYDRHEGHGGATIADTTAHVAGYLAANPADILIVTVGVNDAKAPWYRSAAQMALDYAALLLAARTASPGIRILASEVIPPNGQISAEYRDASVTAQEFNALLPTITGPYGDEVRIAHNGRFILDRNDGLHPDVVVYLLMAWYNLREMWSWLSARPPVATDAGVLRYDPYA